MSILAEGARLAGQKSVLNAKFARLRREYFEAYRTGQNLGGAEKEYKEYLQEKDHYFANLLLGLGTSQRAWMHIQGAETMTGGWLDGGIAQAARPHFDAWINRIRKELGATSPTQLLVPGFNLDARPENIQRALEAAKGEYEAYKRARDRADLSPKA